MLSQISSTSKMRWARLSWSIPRDFRVTDINGLLANRPCIVPMIPDRHRPRKNDRQTEGDYDPAPRSYIIRNRRPARIPVPWRRAMSLNLFNLTGKVALVTGGSKGLGKA